MRPLLILTLITVAVGCAEAVHNAPEVDMLRSSPVVDPLFDMLVRFDLSDPQPEPGAPDAAPVSVADAALDARPVEVPVDMAIADDAAAVGDAQPPGIDAAPMPADAGPMPVDAAPGCPMAPEICNGRDEDCDGVVDEEAGCGRWIESHCRIGLGWADENRGPAGPAASWWTCPPAERDMSDGNVRCTMTRRDGRYVKLDLNGDVDGNDQLALSFDCTDAALPELADYAATHCAVFLGWADNNRGSDNAVVWGDCPQALQGGGDLRCTSSGFDRQFRALTTGGDVDENDDLGIAFICRDPANQARAAALQASVQVELAWASGNQGPADGAERWTDSCPAEERVQTGRIFQSRHCTHSAGDGRFHKLNLARDIDSDDDLGIALKAR